MAPGQRRGRHCFRWDWGVSNRRPESTRDSLLVSCVPLLNDRRLLPWVGSKSSCNLTEVKHSAAAGAGCNQAAAVSQSIMQRQTSQKRLRATLLRTSLPWGSDPAWCACDAKSIFSSAGLPDSKATRLCECCRFAGVTMLALSGTQAAVWRAGDMPTGFAGTDHRVAPRFLNFFI